MKTLSFVIPVYNEEKRLYKTFQALEKTHLPKGLQLKEVIFVNDGSTDETNMLTEKFGKSKKIKAPVILITYPENQGKGFAIRSGMQRSQTDYTLFFDADMSTPLSEIHKLYPFMLQGKDVILGTRKNGRSTVIHHQPFLREILGKCFTKITQLILQVDVSDFTCGFKAFSKKARVDLFSQAMINGWAFDAEIAYVTKIKGLSLVEKSVIWSNDENTKVKILRVIPETLRDLLRIRYTYSLKPTILSLTRSLFFAYK